MRARALLLFALFLCAGTSLPSLDAVLYHRHDVDKFDSGTHLDPVGGCGGHADHCTLGRTPPGSRSVLEFAVEIRLTHSTAVAPLLEPVSPAHVLSRGTLPQPRAPPAPAV
jgi:hypothetical protein